MNHQPNSPAPATEGIISRFAAWCQARAEVATRAALAVVFVWFGALKLAGVSPAEPLITQTFFFLPRDVVVYGLGGVEVLIGLLLVFRGTLKWALLLIACHLPGTFISFLIVPARCFHGPFQLTTEGEFIVKNLVILSATLFLVGRTLPQNRRAQAD